MYSTTFSQEVQKSLVTNPYLITQNVLTKSGNAIDSTFQSFSFANIDLPVKDDFSTNKFVDYTVDFSGTSVTSVQYFSIMDAANTTALPANTVLCDSVHSHHVNVVTNLGIIESTIDYPNTGIDVFINDLNIYPVVGQPHTLFNECYVLIDSVTDGVVNPTQDTVWYIDETEFVQDSARVFFDVKNDPNKIWIDDFAFHNYRYATSPKSLGVVTFDGVSNTGYPYQWGGINAYGEADVLTSKPINLAGKTNVYLTFLYQAKGLGNSPEAFDSLILELYDPVGDIWYYSNAASGFAGADGDVADDVWYLGHVSITQTVLLVNGFQFRFRNKATVTGLLDHWHIDYVNLRENSYAGDTIIDDLAIAEPIESFLIDYSAVPWDHYKNLADPNSVMKSSYELKVENNHTTAKLQSVGQLVVDGNTFSLPISNVNWSTGFNAYNFGINTQPYVFPQTVGGTNTQASFDVKVSIGTSSTNSILENDTTYLIQDFRNYYAYDDGTAETAYGIEVNNARLAYKFEAYEADTLAGVLMKFIPTNANVIDKIFLLTLWEDNNGEPGDIIYQDNFFNPHYPIYSGKKDSYKFYKFNNNDFIPVPKTYYVGWEQISNDILYIGMDLNTDNSDKIFYNAGGSWANTSFTGSLIIRPVYSTAMNNTLVIDETIELNRQVLVYPNPTNDVLNFNGLKHGDYIQIVDLSGRVVLNQKYTNTAMYLNALTNGIYIVNITDENNQVIFTDKVIKF